VSSGLGAPRLFIAAQHLSALTDLLPACAASASENSTTPALASVISFTLRLYSADCAFHIHPPGHFPIQSPCRAGFFDLTDLLSWYFIAKIIYTIVIIFTFFYISLQNYYSKITAFCEMFNEYNRYSVGPLIA